MGEAAASQRHVRIPALDGLRGLAIVAVILNHAFQVKLLWAGVDLFFILSGFLITGILLRQRERHSFRSYIAAFYQRRALRILPPYLIFLIVLVLVFGVGWLAHGRWLLYLGLQNFIPPLKISQPEVATPLWSLAVEEQFYLLWPLAVFFLTNKHLKALAIALIVAAPVLRGVCTPLIHNHWSVYMLLPFRMDTLALGALIAILCHGLHGLHPRRRVLFQGICATVIAAALTALLLLDRHGISTYHDSVTGNVTIYLCTLAICGALFCAVLAGGYQAVFAGRYLGTPLAFFGRISYSLYLFHPVAIYLFHDRRYPGIALAIVFATLMWMFVERPLLRPRPSPAAA